MTRTFYPGGSYVDALPSGEFAVLFPGSHLETHLGRIALPVGDEPLYHRITNVGAFKIAGQAHNSARTLEWIDGVWYDRPVACGVSPVIYDPFGQPLISQCGPVGSQGFRYFNSADGRVITGDQTYSSTFGLNEWSEYAGVYIGQGHDGGGCLVWDGVTLRRLEAGDCRFIRVQGSHEAVAISFVKPDGAVIIQATLQELRALPPVQASPVVTPSPSPVPPIPPEPKPVSVPNQLSVVQRVRAKYPTPLGAQHPLFLIDVAQATGAKLLRKDGGTHVTLPTGVNVSQDILMFPGSGVFTDQGVDILSDGEGAAVPTWQEKGTIVGEYIDVSGLPTSGPPPSNPGTPAPVPSVDLAPLLAEIAALRAQVSAVGRMVNAISDKAMSATPPTPPSVVFPKYSGTARLGTTMRFTLEPQ